MKSNNVKNNYIYCIITALLFLLFSGCGSTLKSYSQNKLNPSNLYLDTAYLPANNFVVEPADELFALDNDMLNMVKHVLNSEPDHKKKAVLLLEYIFSSDHIAMSYDHGANVTAIEAFHGSKANCMSLTIMAYALANEAGMDLQFQDIQVPEYWMREGGHQMLMRHVNLLIIKPERFLMNNEWSKEVLQIDFDPEASKSHFKRNIVSKKTIVAMFYNNKGAEALIQGKYNEAYAYFKASTQLDPTYYSAWGNLGVLYKINNHYDLAVETYQYALSLSNEDFTTLENLALLFNKLNREDEASKIENILHVKRLENPHYHAMLSSEAYHKHDYESAIKHLKKAIKLESNFQEFHFNLAKLYLETEQLTLAKSSLKKALMFNKNMSDIDD